MAADPEQAEVIAALLPSVEQLCAQVDPLAVDAQGALPAGVLQRFAELGLFGLTLPEPYGGFGFDLWSAGTIIAQVARRDRSLATTIGLHLGLGTRGLVHFGSAEQHARWLPALAEGRCLAAFAATEPGAGSDLGALATRVTEDGDRLLVDGSKIFVTNGALAGLFTVAAATPGRGGAKGQGLVMIERDDPGLEVGAEEHKLGLRGSSTTSLSLDGLRLPADRMLGEPGQGRAQLAHVLSWGRSLMAAGCCGSGHAALAAARRHCSVRIQFRRSLDRLPVVAAQLDDAAALLFSMEALFRYAASDAQQLERRSLAAKIHCSEGSWELADLSVQLHGGSGYIEESGMPLLLRDARITRIFEGANDVLRIHLGMMLALADRRPALAALGELGRAADSFALPIAALCNDLRDQLGVRLGGAHRLLHTLGDLATLRASVDAAVLRAASTDSSEATRLAQRWLELATDRSLQPLQRCRRLASQSAPSRTPSRTDASLSDATSDVS